MSTSDNITPDLKNLLFFEPNHYRKGRRLRFLIGSLISAGIGTLILLALVTISDPTAKVVQFNLIQGTLSSPTSSEILKIHNITTSLEVSNNNFFRAFNYTQGNLNIFYVRNNSMSKLSPDDVLDAVVAFDVIPLEYQTVRNTSTLNFNLIVLDDKVINFTNLKANQSHFYMIMYVTYKYKIFLFWTTNTIYYQWLDAHVYVDYNHTSGEYNLHNPVDLQTPKDFGWTTGL